MSTFLPDGNRHGRRLRFRYTLPPPPSLPPYLTATPFASALPYRRPLRFRRTLPPPLSTYSGMNKVTDGYLNKISLIMAQVEKAIFFV
jgi:hypothetical protein